MTAEESDFCPAHGEREEYIAPFEGYRAEPMCTCPMLPYKPLPGTPWEDYPKETIPESYLPPEMKSLVDAAVERMKDEVTQTLAPLAYAWEEAIREAYHCGHLHDLARDEMLARNPYRPKEETG